MSSGLGVKLELQLMASATATQDVNHICHLHHNLSNARSLTSSHGHYAGFLTCWATTDTPKILFSFSCPDLVNATKSWFSRSPIHSSASSHLIIPSSVFFISIIIFFGFHWFSLIFINSLLKFCVPPFFSQVWWASLWPLLWIFYQENHLNSFH